MANSKANLSLRQFYSAEEKRLSAMLEAVRVSIAHGGEKGRSLEGAVSKFLRSLLPLEYGISTGFIAYLDSEGVGLSAQMDLIIYDAARGAPLVDLGSCQVYPLEVVYGYVEVTALLTRSKLRECMQQNLNVRSFRNRKYWCRTQGSPMCYETSLESWLPVRSFLVAFDSDIRTTNGLADMLSSEIDTASGAYFHGVYVGGRGFFGPQSKTSGQDAYAASPELHFIDREPLVEFVVSIRRALATYPKCPGDYAPALDSYIRHAQSSET
jgi:hypothetical protein